MKVNEIVREQQLNEVFPLAAIVPALITAIRVGGPPVLGWLARKGVVGAGRFALKHPVATLVGATGYAGYEYLKDLFPNLPEELLPLMEKYAIPAAVILGLIYGGKKLIDKLSRKEREATPESIDKNLRAFIKETATAGGTSAGGIASTATGFTSGGIGTKTRKKKKTNLIRR